MSIPVNKLGVLFICTGNTCRSPMAEGLLKAALAGDSEDIRVGSAGVAAMPGQAASRETRALLKKRNATIKGFKSRVLDSKLLEEASLVIAMTESHADLVRRFFSDSLDDVKLLSDFLEDDEEWSGVDVPDPIGMGASAYKQVAGLIELAIPGIIAEIKTGRN